MKEFEIIKEGLFQDDLSGLIKPMISINEYEPKIDSSSIVVVFFVKNKEAAEDLSVFLEKSAIADIMDAEVSAAPDEDGDYLVFVEVPRNVNEGSIMKMIELSEHLCKNVDWQMQAYKVSKLYPATTENIKKYLQLARQKNI